MRKYLFVYTNGISIKNEKIITNYPTLEEVISYFKDTHTDGQECVIVNIIDLNGNTHLTKELLDKNFEISTEDANDDYYKTNHLIPYLIEFNRNNHLYTWNLIFNTRTNVASIEDDPLINIKTIGELKLILKMANINKELVW